MMGDATSLFGQHGAAWMSDAWYRRAWFVGPQAAGLFLMAVMAGVSAPPPMPPMSVGWAHRPDGKARFEAMRTLSTQAKTSPAAEALLKEKAVAGDPMAAFFMGVLSDPTIERATATAERTKTAEDWYRKAAEQNLSMAQANLGNLLAYERFGVPPDYAEAYRWLQSATPNVPMAQRELGVLYRYGRGIPADSNKAMELIRAAAERGDAGAQTILAQALDHGSDGLLVDRHEATLLFQKAAMANNVYAQRQLAIHLRAGDGIASDPDKAHYWFTRAAANGDSYAKAQLGGASVPPATSGPRAVTPFSFTPIGK